jgi:hypothetical protein
MGEYQTDGKKSREKEGKPAPSETEGEEREEQKG